MLLFGTVCQML